LERGERLRPYPNTVRAIADALGASSETRDALMNSATGRDSGVGDAGHALTLPPAFQDRPSTVSIEAAQRAAAWEVYVELVTRISALEVGEESGLLREALASLHSLFGTVRAILRGYGPDVAAAGDEASEVSILAIAILNDVLRPLLSYWNPLLIDHESRQPVDVPPAEHERSWDRAEEMRDVLAQVRVRLGDYARLLAAAAAVPHPLVSHRTRLRGRLDMVQLPSDPEDAEAATTFGSLLRRLRNEARLTQEELAQRAGLSADAIRRLERGSRRHPYPATLRTLGHALGLDSSRGQSLWLGATGFESEAPQRDFIAIGAGIGIVGMDHPDEIESGEALQEQR
jgi:transcriptional regulator with XRE-family HTH domain